MLAKLQKAKIQANINKYKFYMTNKYIELIISINKIKLDSAKIEAIRI